jgi:hypothetical protein
MNKRSGRSFINLIPLALVLAIMLSLCPCNGFVPYSWLVKIETDDMPSFFKYPGSKLAPFVESRIWFGKINVNDPTNFDPTKYETFWYCKGRAFGLDRHTTLGIDPGVAVGMQISYKNIDPKEEDYRAAANSILRVLVDLRVNHCMLTTVTVPDQSWGTIINALAEEHYIPLVVQVEVPYTAPGAFFIRDESGNRKQTLWYSPNH